MHPGRSSIRKRGCNIWPCTSPCSILLLLSVLLPLEGAVAMYHGNGNRDTIHRVYKVKVTQDVRIWSTNAQLKERRKDGDACPASFSLCAASLGGDCCPENYACAQSSCYATTAAASVCAGTTGMFACPLSLKGGCCSQGLVCATDGCSKPAGATNTLTCPTGYWSCPASLNGNCCANGFGCAVNTCYPLTPATTTLTYTTTEDGAAVTITTTAVTTSTPTTISTVTGDGAVAKFFPSTVSKTEATASAGSSSSGNSGGLSKGAIGGIVAAVAIILVAVLVASFFIIRRLRHTEQVVQTQRETTSGGQTRPATEKKSEVNVRVVPTPSEIEQMENDPLMMNSSIASPRRPGHRLRTAAGHRSGGGGGSDTASRPSLWSGPSVTRWNTPSMNSDADDNSGQVIYFELPPRTHQPTPIDARPAPALRQSVNSNDSAYSYRNNHPADHESRAHGRNASNASELSTTGASDDNGSQHRVGSPSMPVELGVDGEFRPELPGSDTETESNGVGGHGHGHGGRRRQHRGPRRKGAATSLTDIVSPMSVRPGGGGGGGGTAPSASRPRRRGDSQIVSPVEGRPPAGDGGSRRSGLGSIDESASVLASNSLHGHYGPTRTNIGDGGRREAGLNLDLDHASTGFVPLERPSQDGSER